MDWLSTHGGITMNMMKKSTRQGIILPLSLLLLLSFGVAVFPPAHAQDTATISLVPSAGAVYFNDTFTVDIVITADNVTTAQCWLTFNATLLEVVAVQNGNIFASLSGTGDIDNINGTIDNIWGWTIDPVAGGGTLATITFRAKYAVGTATISLVPGKCFVPPYTMTLNDAQVDVRNYPVYITIEPSSESIGNDTARFNVTIDPNGNTMLVFTCNINYNATLFDASIVPGDLFTTVTSSEPVDGILNVFAIETLPGINTTGLLLTLELTPEQSGITDITFDTIDIIDPLGAHLYAEANMATLEADITPPDITINSIAPMYNGYVGIPLLVNVTVIDDHLQEVMFLAVDNDTGQFLHGLSYNYEDYTGTPPADYQISWQHVFALTNGTVMENNITVWHMMGDMGNFLFVFGFYNATGGEPEMPMMALFDAVTHEFIGMHPGPVNVTYGVSTFRPTNLFMSQNEGEPVFVNDSTVFVITEDFAPVPTAPPEIDYILMVRASDSFGNENGEFFNATVDTTAPVTTIDLTGPAGENGWFINNAVVTFDAIDQPSAGVDYTMYRIDGGAWQLYTAPFVVDTEGTHTIDYYSVDNVGNAETVKSAECKVDKTAPTLSYGVSGTQGNAPWYTSTVTINLSALDVISGISEFKYRTNGVWQDYVQPFTLSNGIHTVQFYATNGAGLNASDEFNVSVDKTKPSSSHTLAGTIENGKYTTDVTVTLSASDTGGSGLASIKYRLDGVNWATYSAPFTVSAEGVHTLEYQATDNAGNAETKHQVTFEILKNKKPTADFSYTPVSPTDLDTITFADQSTDEDGDVVAWAWDFGDNTTSTLQNPTHKYADNGTYVVKLTVTDDKGATATKQQIITVSNDPPTALFSFDPPKPKIRDEVTFTSLSTDEDGTIVNFTWNFADGNVSYEENPVHVFEKKGTYNVTLTVMDNDGATHQTMLQVKVIKEEVNTLLYVAIIVALIIIAIIVVVIWRQRTKSS